MGRRSGVPKLRVEVVCVPDPGHSQPSAKPEHPTGGRVAVPPRQHHHQIYPSGANGLFQAPKRPVPAVAPSLEDAHRAAGHALGPEPPIPTEYRDPGLRPAHHAYLPPRASNFSLTKPTSASAASTPTSRMGGL